MAENGMNSMTIVIFGQGFYRKDNLVARQLDQFNRENSVSYQCLTHG